MSLNTNLIDHFFVIYMRWDKGLEIDVKFLRKVFVGEPLRYLLWRLPLKLIA